MEDALQLRRLTLDDEPALQALVDADPGYAERVSGHRPAPDEARGILTGRPPGIDDDHKVVLGAFERVELLAVVDLLRGWPEPATAHVGLLQVHAGRKGQGIGGRTHDLLLEHVRDWPEIDTLRAAIVETNATEAAPFWTAMGYARTGETVPFEEGSVTTTASIWARPL